MKITKSLFLAWLALFGFGQAAPWSPDTQIAASWKIKQLQKQANSNIEGKIRGRTSGCTQKNMVYRQEWGSMPKHTRRQYTKAVECLQKKPALTSPSVAPGARSRYDDFFATHIIQTPNVHFDGRFLPFHRQIVWLYEKALREECGYTGTQPYWDWTLSWKDPSKSTVFDGSPWSMGSNGKYVPHGNTNISGFGLTLSIPPGTGGGCVQKGPFTNYTVNLGPVLLQPEDSDNGLGYNPRCLTRDISPFWSNNTKPTNVLELIDGVCTDLTCFDAKFENITGLHSSGHFSMGGLGNDAYASPGDPAFWLHHAQVDRMWTIWQNLDPLLRTNMTTGTETAFNMPPSPNVTLNTGVDFMVLGPQQIVGDLTSVADGHFCYTYI